MRNKTNNIEAFFIRLFPQVILGNQIVASIIHVASLKLQILKDKVDKHLNTDI